MTPFAVQRRWLAIFSVVMIAVSVAGILFLDGPIARWAAGAQRDATVWSIGTRILDTASTKQISKFLIGFVVLLAGAGAVAVAKWRQAGRGLLFVGSVQLLATVFGGVLKNVFGRLRPFETVLDGRWVDAWHAAGSSFPSGHAAYYAGLFIPAAVLFPRWLSLWAMTPLFIAVARVMDRDHYLSDVAASLAITSLITLAMSFIPAFAPADRLRYRRGVQRPSIGGPAETDPR